MLTVRDLTLNNPFMQEENQFFLRNQTFDVPIKRIREEHEQVRPLDIKIGQVVQAALLALQISLRFTISTFIAIQMGPLFWNFAAIGAIAGVTIGSTIGLQQSNTLTIRDHFIHQSNLYACYKTKIKVLEPALEVGYWLAAYKIEILLLSILPTILGSISTLFTTFIYTSDLSYLLSRSLKNSILST